MRLLNRLDTGRGVRADLEALENLCCVLPGSGRCGLIDGAVTVVESSINQFRAEYEALLMAYGRDEAIGPRSPPAPPPRSRDWPAI
jgi:NADH-quinone oxidoreductase subunit F